MFSKNIWNLVRPARHEKTHMKALITSLTASVLVCLLLQGSHAQCLSGCGVSQHQRPSSQWSYPTNQNDFKSVVMVSSGNSRGSGVVIRYKSRPILLTAAHVVRAGGVELQTLGGTDIPCRVVHVDETWDFAVCVPETSQSITTTVLARTPSFTQTTRLYACGFLNRRLGVRGGFFRRRAAAVGTNRSEWLVMSGTGSGNSSGCSGGPIFNQQGHVVAITWGVREGVYGTQCNYIWTALEQLDLGTGPPEEPRKLAIQPILPSPEVQPPTIQPIPPAPQDNDLTKCMELMDLKLVPIQEAIASLDIRVTSLEGQQVEPGPAGERGPMGEQGPPGSPGPPGKSVEADIQEIVEQVLASLPPVEIELADSFGNVASTVSAPLGVSLQLPPVKLRTFDRDGEIYQEAEAPLGEPIGLRSKFFVTTPEGQ